MYAKPEYFGHQATLRQRLLRVGPTPSRMWPWLLAGVAALALLLAFHEVVQDGVRQAESRRQAQAALVEATWRCNLLGGGEAASLCLQALAGPTQANQLERPMAARADVLPRIALLSDGAQTR